MPHSSPASAQYELEQWCRNIGAERALQPGWERGAQGCLGNRIAALYIKKVREIYEKSKHTPGRQMHIWRLMHSSAAVDHVALESLIYVLGNVGNEISFNALAATLGKRAECVLWLTHPSWGQSQHLKGLKLAGGRSLDMSEMLARLRDKGFKKASLYRKLEHVERAALGAFFIECIAEATKMVEVYVQVRPKRKKRMVRYTNLYWDFLKLWEQSISIFRPVKLPMMVPPVDWQGHSDGGYLTLGGSISTVPWERWPEVSKNLHPCVLGSVNLLQSIVHEWDHDQVKFTQDLWRLGHGLGSLPPRDRLPRAVDSEFKAKGLGPSAYWRAVWDVQADRRKDGARSAFVHACIGYQRLQDADEIYWVWGMDHRGRKYQRGAQLSVQNADHYRAMFQFKEKSPVKGHEVELAWSLCDALGVGGDEQQRFNQLMTNRQLYQEIGRDPLSFLGEVGAAKEPFRFVQLCRDWAGYLDDPGYTSGTIHWLDQTCSGWGHVACLTGDATLAQYTNITGTKPVDLYMGLGALVNSRVRWMLRHGALDTKQRECFEWWDKQVIPRSLWKKALMPVIYGRSYMSLTETINVYLRDELNNFLNEEGVRVLDLSRTLASTINEVVKEALPHVRDLAKWLSTLSAMQIDAGLRPYWFTPNGLAVECYASESHVDRIELNLAGRKMTVSVREPSSLKPDKRKTARRLVPDFIHSQDAAFLERFVHHWGTYKHPINTVHDCFGTTLRHVSMMRAELNDQWARFYSVDHLERHRAMVSDLLKVPVPTPPRVGTLDRTRIGENPYLFC